jgi:hypothetical protein
MPRAPKSAELRDVVSTRLRKEDRARLAKLATERRWTVSAYVEWVLEQHLAATAPKPARRAG